VTEFNTPPSNSHKIATFWQQGSKNDALIKKTTKMKFIFVFSNFSSACFIQKCSTVVLPCRDFDCCKGGTGRSLFLAMLLTEPVVDSTRFSFPLHYPVMAWDGMRAEDASWDETRRQVAMNHQNPAEDDGNHGAILPGDLAQVQVHQIALPETSQGMSVLDRVSCAKKSLMHAHMTGQMNVTQVFCD
jgi:hypothetical protein